ncbi:hypothetical protein KO116_P200192 (plasmid) [Halomonas sp. KO116]|nr:hypothetical protein KO116_P200192 [Halomonas sp. KO116]
MDTPGKVILVDGASASCAQVECLVREDDILLVAHSDEADPECWRELYPQPSDIRLVPVSRALKQATGLSLAFAAGELVASRKWLIHVPWLIVSSSQDFQAITNCLAQRGIERCMQVTVHPLPDQPSNDTSLLHGANPVAEELNELIQRTSGYPILISQVRPLITEHAPNVVDALKGRGKLKKQLWELGFHCDAKNVVSWTMAELCRAG